MEKGALHDFTLTARDLLTKEAMEVLEGIYGLHPDCTFESIDHLPVLVSDSKALITRQRLEVFLNDEIKAGLDGRDAFNKLIKEIAFTWLNRLIAFKMMENQELIRQTISKGIDSDGFKRWITQDNNTNELKLFDQGDSPLNAFGEGPRDLAYRHFILWQCSEISKEIKVLFNTDSMPSRIFPRPRILKILTQMIEIPELQDVWKVGNEETIGWIYQYFNEKEKNDIFYKLYKLKQKIRAQDIPAATQLFTPRWIVKWIVQNTLGRYWVQMHPDTRLIEKLDYFVPLVGETPSVELKPVKDITILDPACGTMHFGLVAFDILYEMYQEELDNAGRIGWPKKPSVSDKKDIASTIIAYNIHGIDIDLRAVQLSALTLYLKSKSYNKDTIIRENNLASADILPLNSYHLNQFISEMKLSNTIYERIIRALWEQLHNANHIGSLLKIEYEIRKLIEDEKRRFQKEGHQLNLSGYPIGGFEDKAFDRQYWDDIENKVLGLLNEFAQRQYTLGYDESYFVGEATKGIKLLDILSKKYDVIVTNPPYIDNRDFNPTLKKYIGTNYPNSKRNLFSAFIERCNELSINNGRIGIISGQSFMFISVYENFRNELIKHNVIECLLQLDYGLFEARVDTTAFILNHTSDENYLNNSLGTFIRLKKEKDSESKRLRYEKALVNLNNHKNDSIIYSYRQSDFKIIPGSPWICWISPKLLEVFKKYNTLEKYASAKPGVATTDNLRFLRFWWEVEIEEIGFKCKNSDDAINSGCKWFPYMKGGPFNQWYGNQEYIINWYKDGFEIKNIFTESGQIASRHRNSEFYFKKGITYSFLTCRKFNARLSPGGFIFDVAGSSIFPENILFILGILNSNIADYILKLINPTVNFQPCDLARLPIPSDSNHDIEELVSHAISIAKIYDSENETTYNFVLPPWHISFNETIVYLKNRAQMQSDIEDKINDDIYNLYGINIFEREKIESELKSPIIIPDCNVENEIESNDEALSDSTKKILSPNELAIRWVSYSVGIVLGRFSPGNEGTVGSAVFNINGQNEHFFSPEKEKLLKELIIQNGISILDKSHPKDLVKRIIQALEIMLGEKESKNVITAIGGSSGDVYESLYIFLERDFFKLHLKWYHKRPEYWLLQSPNKKYSVYVFYNRLTKDTLYLIQSNQYLMGKINETIQKITETTHDMAGRDGKDKKILGNKIEKLDGLLSELNEFNNNIQCIHDVKNDRNEVIGWAPELDDGIIINLSPLIKLIPSWNSEPKKYWDALKAGEYDWSYTAMRYWPNRVLEKCKTDKSIAIAHNRLDIYKGGK